MDAFSPMLANAPRYFQQYNSTTSVFWILFVCVSVGCLVLTEQLQPPEQISAYVPAFQKCNRIRHCGSRQVN